ncbi:MAG TPA: TetR/AcrR family transcriptional regulator [Pseudonocardiaceae bacterium]|nr:TetR/AcrR family transcriptional regulator [Pseudonocardiaceae bacterium]
MNIDVRIGTVQSPPSLLQTATEVLVVDPSASLSDVATAAGIGRTTLHKLYPTRHALLVALAHDALDLLERTDREVGLDAPGTQAPAVLRRLVTAVIPLGPRMAFLRRERSLDTEPELIARVEALDAPVRALVRRAQAEGVFSADLPDEWVVASLNSLVFTAWALIAQGRIAPIAAPELVMRILLGGIETPHSPRS